MQHRRVGSLVVDGAARLIGNEGVYAHISLRLVAVACEPSYVCALVDDEHVVVGRRIVGVTHVFGLVESLTFGVVSCDVKIVIAIPLIGACRKIENLSVGHEKRVIEVGVVNAKS